MFTSLTKRTFQLMLADESAKGALMRKWEVELKPVDYRYMQFLHAKITKNYPAAREIAAELLDSPNSQYAEYAQSFLDEFGNRDPASREF